MVNRFHSGLSPWFWIALFVVATFAVLAGSYLYYRTETERIQQAKYEEIAAIAKLKAGQIVQWRRNRLEDVGAVAKGPMFKRAINEWLRDPVKAAAHQDLTDRLATILQARRYADASLLDLNGHVLLSATGQTGPVSASEEKAVQYAIANRSSISTDLHRTPSGTILITAVAPLLDPDGRPIAVVLLRSNPDSVLFPLIQSWPTPSRTAETLLARRDGEEVLFLNDLRHRPNSALSLREPLTRSDLPAVQAVLGKEGMFLGSDYRGVEVLADLRAIPDSPWFMVAKVDASEILAEARYRGGMVALFAVLFIVLAAGTTAYGYRYRQVRLYRDLYRSEREQQAALREFRTTLYSIGDAVITTDTEGRIKQMNPTAERLTGWSEVEAQGKPLSKVFRIANERTRAEVEDPVARVLREGVVVGLANHTLLIAKDGSEHPIADSGAPIFDEGGAITGVVLVFQDQTEGRRQVNERETRLALLQLINEHTDTHELIRNIIGFLQVRSGFEAVGMRLKEGDDFPYFETRGFSQEFVRSENYLCERDLNGQLVRDPMGHPALECMCGNVLSGRFNPALPFFTAKGSFWTNSSTELLANTTEADRQARTRNRCNGEGYESVGLFRLRSGDETLGLLQLNDRAKGRFTPELLDFMESTADEIAIALAQRQAQARLQESEELFSKAFKNNPAWLTIVNLETRKTMEVNDAWTRLFGYTREEAIGRSATELGIYDEESYRKIVEAVIANGSTRNEEVTVTNRAGEQRVVLVSRELIAIRGEPHFLAMGLDITERKQAEEALRTSENKFSKAFRASPDAVVISRRDDGLIIETNEKWESTFGYKREEVIGRNSLEIGLLENPEDRFRAIAQLQEQGFVRDFEVNIRKKSGEIRQTLLSAEAIEINSEPCILTIIRDVTESKRAEATLRTSEAQLANAVRIARLGHWEYDVAKDLFTFNDHFYEIYRTTADQVGGYTMSSAEYSRRFVHPDDVDSVTDEIRKSIETTDPHFSQQLEHRMLYADGEGGYVVVRIFVVKDDSGRTVRTYGVNQDITERKEAEEALRKSENQYRLLVDMAPDPIVISQDGRIIYVNRAAVQLLGATDAGQVVGTYPVEWVHPDDRDVVGHRMRVLLDSETLVPPATWRLLRRDGSVREVEAVSGSLRSGESMIIHAMLRDITERRRTEQAVRESEERYRSLFDNMLEGFAYCRMIFDNGRPLDFIYLDVNTAFDRLTGLKDVIGKKVTELIPGIRESNRELLEAYGRVALTGKPEKLETYVEPLGIWFSVSVYSTEREHFVAVFDNITERKRAEQALQESEERFRTLADGAFEGVVISREGVILDTNQVFCQMSGYSLNELVGMNIRETAAPEFREIAMGHILSGSQEAYESAVLRKDGHVVPALIKGKTIPYEGGTARIASVRDISAVRKAEEVQRRLTTAIEQSAEAVLITDTSGVIQYVNPAVERSSGFSRDDLLGKTPRVFRSGEHDAAFYRQLWNTIKAGNIWSGRFVNKRRDGSSFHEDATISPVRGASGEITNFVAVKRDITEHLELSNQLFQAQKMEAVGTLAGGVAHDFNNLLQVVLGYSELILFDQNLPPRLRDDLGKINHAARNGADLVQRLLTFSRKTEVEPRPLNLNRRIEQFQKMLSRTIPKMIEIDLVLSDELLPISADPSQMEQILMNLALNARDAMPEGGRLVIETRNVTLDEQYCKTHLEAKPGRYVFLSVSDTGQGMDKETLQHIFEPFFTTKRPGEGTGLGLAMVYGIVKQHGGQIMCYSEPGEGTTFKVYFPALVSGEESQQTEQKTLPRGGSETVLIVDDEEMLRDLGARILTKAGYKTITASNGREALEVYRGRQDEIALVILDLIMHEMGGKECLKGLLSLDPSAKVVIASGYSASDSIKEVLSSGAKGFINKPYDIHQVLEIVRSVLDEDTGTESV